MPVSVSAILPTHNRRESLLRALESIRRQTRQPVEIVVVADGCTDGSVEAVRGQGDDRVLVLDLPKGNGKGWAHRNAPVERARGDVVAYLSDDDLWLCDHLERIGAVWDAVGPDLVQASSCLVGTNGRLELFAMDWSEPRARARLLAGSDCRTPMSAVSHRHGLSAQAGGWHEAPDGPGDEDLWRRIAALNPHTEIVREPTVLFMPASPVHGGRRVEHDPARAARQADLLGRIADPLGVVAIRQEVTRAAFRAQEDQSARERSLSIDRDRMATYVESLREHVQAKELSEERAVAYARQLERARATDADPGSFDR
jgi:hypothetical protein